MKQLFKILLAVSVIAFAVSMTAGSCGKPDAGGGNNNNSGGGNSGGGDGGGGTPDLGADIKINITDANLAKLSGNTVLLKLSAWTEAGSATSVINAFRDTLLTATSDARKKAFEIVHDKASEGMLLVGKGNIANAGAITTAAPVASYPANHTGNDGIHIVRAATANQGTPAGLSFFSVFANTNTPTTAAQAAADAEPFSFSPTGLSGFDNQPIFWCVATAPAITAVPVATDKLVGAHKADCLVAAPGDSFGGTTTARVGNRTTWWGKADPFKREFQVAVVAIQTDGKTIGELMPGADAAAKLANFNDGIGADDMKAIATASSSVQFKKFNLKIVKDADF